MSQKPAQGATVYDINGRAARYIAHGTAGHIVEPLYDLDREEGIDYEESYHCGSAETWPTVYTKPPTARLDAEVVEIQKRIRGLRDESHLTASAIRDLKIEQSALLIRIKARPDLVDLDLWLQGNVTHIVSLSDYGGGFTISTVDETLIKDDREHSVRLLNLRVDPKANRYWVGYAEYADGGSRQTRCLLATSFEHAKERAAEYFAALMKEKKEYQHSAVCSCLQYGIPVSAELLARHADVELKGAEARVVQYRGEVQRAQAQLDAAQSVLDAQKAKA